MKTDLPTIAELDAQLVEAVAAELAARRGGLVDDQVACMNKIRLIREEIQQRRTK
jgi:hypothetical protein